MENTPIASAMNIGQQTARRCHSMCMELSMYQSRTRHQILLRKKVWENKTKISFTANSRNSEISFGAVIPSQGRAGLHCGQGEDAQEYCREYKCKSEMVECIPAGRSGRDVYISGVVVEEVFRGKPSS